MTETVEKKEDAGTDLGGVYKRWMAELKLWEKREKTWHDQGDKVVKRYRDEREKSEDNTKKVNILWSNTETLKPSLYFKTPKPQIDRRFRDKDEVAKVAGKILERAVEYSIDEYDFDGLAKDCVEDYLLPGRSTARVVYKPVYGDPIVDPTTKQPKLDEQGQPIKEVAYESVECEYVFWKDLAVGPGRRWTEVPWLGFRSYLTRDELVKRFGDKGQKVTLDYVPEESKDLEGGEFLKKGTVWEIWSKTDGKVYFISPGYKDEPLEVSDPPLRLRKFFPCPKPLQSLKTNNKLTPKPEFTQYQDHADEIDKVTQRIDNLTDALRVVGVYAADNPDRAIEQMLTSGVENKLIPIASWAIFTQKGGLDGMISWLPVEQVIKVVKELYIAREQLKQSLYEVTGIADIIRGASDPNETATAQRIKGKFASLRLEDRQKAVSEFLRDLIELKAEVIAEQFSPETLQLMTGVTLPTMQEKQASMQAGQQVAAPTWEEIMKVLRSDPIRCFRIDIETDSTIQVDDQAEKEARTEFLTAATGFMEKAVPLAQMSPELKPLLSEMLMFGVRGFRSSRDLETAFEKAMEEMNQPKPQQPPPPDPKMIETEAKVKDMDKRFVLDANQQQHEQKVDVAKLQLDAASKAQQAKAKTSEANA